LQRQQRLVVFGIRKSLQERLVQPVVDCIVEKPDAQIAVQSRLERAVGLPEGVQRREPFLGRFAADAVEQLVNVHIYEGQRGRLHVAVPHFCSPGKITAQLAHVHRFVGGKVTHELPRIAEIVLVSGHHHGLVVEALLGALAVKGKTFRELLHLPDLVRHIAVQTAGRP